MKTTQPELPAMPRDWREPITVDGADLAALEAEATAAGWYAFRMTRNKASYELTFLRLPANATR